MSHACLIRGSQIWQITYPSEIIISNLIKFHCTSFWNYVQGAGPWLVHKQNLVYMNETAQEVNALGWRQNALDFADGIFKCIIFSENAWISIEISLKFVPKGLINNIPPFVQIMAWYWPGDKPLSEPMMVSLLTHICVSQPWWVNP